MLNTPPRSTRHSAVDFPFPDIVHWFPIASSLVYSPSTALNAPHRASWEYCCHAGLFRAKFSKVITLYKIVFLSYSYANKCLTTVSELNCLQTNYHKYSEILKLATTMFSFSQFKQKRPEIKLFVFDIRYRKPFLNPIRMNPWYTCMCKELLYI